MRIESGLFDNMVLQRAAKNVCHAKITGQCDTPGGVVAVVKRGGRVVKGFSGVKIGTAAGGTFRGTLKGLRCGGPYTVQVGIVDRQGIRRERLTVRNVLVGDVWVLAGQSNMEGIGWIRHALKPHGMTRALYMDDRWDVAKDPLHELAIAVDEAHAIIAGGPPDPRLAHVGVGPGVGFLQEMHRLSGVPQGALACAHGGTSMAQWDPGRKGEGSRSLYGATLRRVAKNGGRVAGVFWYQGCSDADEANAPLYTRRMAELVNASRVDLGARSLPWVVVQIAAVCGEPSGSTHWDSIQEQQRLLPKRIGRLVVVPAIDLALDDGIHVAGDEQNRLGRRAARAMALVSGRSTTGKPPIALRGARVVKNRFSGTADVVVTFDNVVGRLVSQGRPWGFSLADRVSESRVPIVFRTDLEENRVILRTVAGVPEVQSTFVYYGLGRFPHCTIADMADRSLPVFGPHYLGGNRVYSPFVTRLQVSRFMPSAGQLHALAYPVDKAPLGLAVRQFDTTFCSLHPEIASAAVDDLLVYFAVPVTCAEEMDVEVWLGYDGPVKMWVDGEQRLFDPDGVNPALPDDSCTKVHWAAGPHEILVALGSNQLKAWGIFLRLVRTGVPVEQIVKGPEHYAVPEPAL